MISLREHIDAVLERQFSAALEAYRAALVGMSEHAKKVCPQLGDGVLDHLAQLADDLNEHSSPESLQTTKREVEQNLDQWGGRARDYFRQRTDDVKELMLVVAQTAQSLGERDQRNSRELGEFIGRVRAVADLSDLAEIRRSLSRNANDLKACVEAMTTDSQKAVTHLQSQLAVYQERLHEAERLIAVDSLTGLLNRRSLEIQIQERARAGQPFTIVFLDLNHFKKINDLYGHAAGDEILRQFATELKSRVLFPDVAGRWGGDEFLVLVRTMRPDAATRTASWLKDWLFGDYAIELDGQKRAVRVTAAIGAANWVAGSDPDQTLREADQAMYRDKKVYAADHDTSAPARRRD